MGKKNIGEKHELDDLEANENLYRVRHPLAQKVIAKCKEESLQPKQLVFNLSGSDKKISILEPLIGKEGWLQAKQISISSFEMEDHILFAAVDEGGYALVPDQCQRLFSLEATVDIDGVAIPEEIQNLLNESYHSQQVTISEENAKRNHVFFDDEVDKLEKWSEDVRNSIKFEIKELDKEIKTRKTEARKMLNLEEKVKEQRLIKELEKKLAEKRYNQYQNEDDIEHKKDELLDEVEKRLKQHTTETELFTIRWKVI